MRIHVFFFTILLVIVITESRRGGGFRSGSFGRSSSSSRSGSSWFSRSRSSSSRSSSFGRSRTGGYSRVGSGSTYPKQQFGSAGSIGGRKPIGGGGFVNPKATGVNSFKSNGFGQKQYSGWSKPKTAFGTHTLGGKKFGYRTPGYGTSFGTNFAGGAGKYTMKKGFSKKALGLGVAAGFIGGAALGAAGAMATYSVYHRYHSFRQMMYMRNPSMFGDWDDNYYSNYYSRYVIVVFS